MWVKQYVHIVKQLYFSKLKVNHACHAVLQHAIAIFSKT